jgi:hypothetical protein
MGNPFRSGKKGCWISSDPHFNREMRLEKKNYLILFGLKGNETAGSATGPALFPFLRTVSLCQETGVVPGDFSPVWMKYAANLSRNS